jgi:hypothetical protein
LDRNECFGILGIAPGATQAEIRGAYLSSIMAWHPGRHAHSPKLAAEAERRTQAITRAYRELTENADGVPIQPPPRKSPEPSPNSSGHKSYQTGFRAASVPPCPSEDPTEQYSPLDYSDLNALGEREGVRWLILDKQAWILFFEILIGVLAPVWFLLRYLRSYIG